MRRYIYFAGVALMTLVAQATRAACPANGHTTIIFGNGISTTVDEAQYSLDNILAPAILQALGPTVDQSCISFALAYDSQFIDSNNNVVSTANMLAQIADAGTQLGIDFAANFWNYWYVQPPAWFQDLQRQFILSATSVYQKDLLTHESLYNAELAAGHMVIVVAHSQGNLYANQAFELVTASGGSDLFHIVAVATPADHVAGFGPYFTLHGDIITIVPFHLSANMTNDPPSPCPTDPLLVNEACHSFDNSYMDLQNGDHTRPAIVNAVVAFLSPAVMDDDFNDNSLNPRLWATLSPPPTSTVTVTETNQRLEVTMSSGSGGGGILSRCSVSGDFDVQVDYALLNWPSNNSHSLRLGAYDLGGGTGMNRFSGISELYVLSPGGTANTSTTDTSGQLRLVRTGSTISGFFRSNSGSNWTFLGSATVSTVATRFNLDLGTSFPFAPGGVLVAFDNFKVNAGTISCPSGLTTYTFTGAPFNQFLNTSCPPVCRITGSITLAQPLPPNINLPVGQLAGSTSNFTPLAFSFTDGVTTATNQTCPDTIFNANTDANGNITQYAMSMCFSQGSKYFFLFYYPPDTTQEGINNGAAYQAYFFGGSGASGGTWSKVP